MTKSNKSELGVFWLSENGTEVVHSKTVLEEDIDPNVPNEFLHAQEWRNHPPGLLDSYTFYPRGRIFYDRGKYSVELSGILLDPVVISTVQDFFHLPPDTKFVVGLRKHQ
jgi:hypothetical protein